jgi:hypothetical protein
MRKQQRATLMAISSGLLAVAPKCPICFFAYFGIFGVATSSVSEYRFWLPPLTAIWLVFTVGMLVFRRDGKRRYGPALLGFFAAVAVLVGRFVLNDQGLIYTGIAALIAAVVWRSWLQKPIPSEGCLQCEQLPLLHVNEAGVKRPTELPTYGGD